MRIYSSSEQLKDNVLNAGDYVNIFKTLHIVERNYLRNLSILSAEYSDLFIIFNINKYDFCSRYFGYKVTDGEFPFSKIDDYKALTRAAMALFKFYEQNKVRLEKERIEKLITGYKQL